MMPRASLYYTATVPDIKEEKELIIIFYIALALIFGFLIHMVCGLTFTRFLFYAFVIFLIILTILLAEKEIERNTLPLIHWLLFMLCFILICRI